MRGSVVEPICLRAVGAVNDTGGTRVLDPRNSLLILRRDMSKPQKQVRKNTNRVDSLRKNNIDSFHFMAS